MKPHILFLLKKNLIYGSYSSVIAKSGLLNSATITSHQLHKHHVPIVVSKTIDWMPAIAKADVENMEDIVSRLAHAYDYRGRMANKNTRYLIGYNRKALEAWKDFFIWYAI